MLIISYVTSTDSYCQKNMREYYESDIVMILFILWGDFLDEVFCVFQ